MHRLGKKIQYLVIRKDTSILCGLICALHIFLAPFCFYFGFNSICRYHLYVAFLYTILIALSKAFPSIYLFTLCYFETILYTLLMAFLYGNDVGSYILTLTLITYLAIISIDSKRFSKRLILPIALTLIEIFFIQIIQLIHLERYLPFPRRFYLLHYTLYVISSVLILCFEAFLIQRKVLRFKEKNSSKTEFLKYSSTHDALTNILNRRQMMQNLNKFQFNDEFKNKMFSIAIFDIDDFKKINDIYGHNYGDIALKELSSFVQQNLSNDTIFARWGGEEFLILFKTDFDSAKNNLNEIKEKIQNHKFQILDKSIILTITIGLSSFDIPANFSKLLIEADNNLMVGKKSGKNCIICSE